MTAFTVWKFDEPDAASRASSTLKQAASEGFVKVLDHAVVSWPVGAEQPSTKHGRDDVKRGAGWGALFGVLGGALFLVPVVGGVAGAAIGLIHKATQDFGITREQLETIRTQITEGTSALFLVTEHADLDRLGERFRVQGALIATNLTEGEREVLLQTFGGSDETQSPPS